jgi:hypothetical protein
VPPDRAQRETGGQHYNDTMSRCSESLEQMTPSQKNDLVSPGNSKMPNGLQKAERVQQPHDYQDDYDCIQD